MTHLQTMRYIGLVETFYLAITKRDKDISLFYPIGSHITRQKMNLQKIIHLLNSYRYKLKQVAISKIRRDFDTSFPVLVVFCVV